MQENIYRQMVDFINHYKNFLIFGHEEPDGDSVGSVLALAHWLKRQGKQAGAFMAGPFEKLEIMAYQDSFRAKVEPADITAQTAVIIIDCSSLSRTGLAHELLTPLPSLIIDHHGESSNEGSLCYIDAHSPSATLLVQKLMEAYGTPPDKYEAELLLLGFCTDTGFFRHLDAQQSEALVAAARLVNAGVSLQDVYARIYWGKELKQAKLLGKLLTRVESFADQKILFTWQEHTDYPENAPKLRVTEDLYRYLQSIKDNEIVIFIKEKNADECSVSLRSSSSFNVGKLAAFFGGGGHFHAAGFNMQGTAGQIKAKVLHELSRHFKLEA